MIDWPNVFANALWILALSIFLAVLSYSSWQASESGRRFRDVLGQSGMQFWLNIAGFLFSLGLFFTTPAGWQKILWLLPALYFLFLLLSPIFLKPRSPEG